MLEVRDLEVAARFEEKVLGLEVMVVDCMAVVELNGRDQLPGYRCA
jgi:catechol-2,3-dioxygenase